MNVEDLANKMGGALANEQAAAASLGDAVSIDHQLQDRVGQTEALFDAGENHTLVGLGSAGLVAERLQQFLAGTEEMARAAEDLPAKETELLRKLIEQLRDKTQLALGRASAMGSQLNGNHAAVKSAHDKAKAHVAHQPDGGHLQQTSHSAADHTRQGLERL
jgi:ABC-type nitrate/sulfonate/bicarbonate transport system substrate-binding protein